jgi:hypothetical protein
MWIIACGKDRSEAETSRHEAPSAHASEHVFPVRIENDRESYRRLWWQHVEARPKMFTELGPLERFLVTATVSKRRLFG